MNKMHTFIVLAMEFMPKIAKKCTLFFFADVHLGGYIFNKYINDTYNFYACYC